MGRPGDSWTANEFWIWPNLIFQVWHLPKNIMTYFCYTSQVTDVGLHILEMFFRLHITNISSSVQSDTFWLHILDTHYKYQ